MDGIDFDGFDHLPGMRRELVTFIEVYCAGMTLSQAREWFDSVFRNDPTGRFLNLP